MKFCWTTIYVRSLDQSVNFYSNILGLGIVNQFTAGPNMRIAMLGDPDGTLIELIEEEGTYYQANIGLSIGFQVEDIEKALGQIQKSGISIKRGPVSPMPTSTFFFIEDPDGLEVQIVQFCNKK